MLEFLFLFLFYLFLAQLLLMTEVVCTYLFLARPPKKIYGCKVSSHVPTMITSQFNFNF